MLKSFHLQRFALNATPSSENGLTPTYVHVGGPEVVEALVVSMMGVVLDDSIDVRLEVTGQVVMLEQDAVSSSDATAQPRLTSSHDRARLEHVSCRYLTSTEPGHGRCNAREQPWAVFRLRARLVRFEGANDLHFPIALALHLGTSLGSMYRDISQLAWLPFWAEDHKTSLWTFIKKGLLYLTRPASSIARNIHTKSRGVIAIYESKQSGREFRSTRQQSSRFRFVSDIVIVC